MNSKERVLTTIDHKEPDKIPIDSWMVYELQESIRSYLNIDISRDRFLMEKALGNDMLYRYIGISEGFNSIYKVERKVGNNLFKDRWGIIWKKVTTGCSSYCVISEYPLKDIKRYDNYKWPNPLTDEIDAIEMYKELINRDGKEYAIVGAISCTMLEASWYLRGLENFLIDLYKNKDFAIELLDKTMRYHLTLAKKLVELGVDIVWFGDDIASEQGPLLNPTLYRELIKPRHAFMIQELKKINRDIKIAYHTDGNIEWVLNDLIEIGVDILNPLQPDVNDVAMIKKKYGKKLTFWGNVDTRKIMSEGSCFDVIQEVKNVIRTLAPGGGFILCSNHRIQNTPRAFENLITFYWAAHTFRKYPIKLSVIKKQYKADWYL